MVQKHLFNHSLARTAGKLPGARRVAMMLLLMMLTTASAWAGVDYVTADGTEKNTDDDDIDVTSLTGNETEIVGGWYVVDHNITYTSPLVFTGDVTLILTDGHTMSFGTSNNPIIGDKQGVFVSDGTNGWYNSLTIYGQSLDKKEAGHLYVYAGQGNNYQPKGIVAENYTQHSGNVTSNAVYSAIHAINDITINGGVVNATSTLATDPSTNTANWCAMFGGRYFTVTGGQLTAKSTSGDGVYGNQNINISGGTVNSTGGYCGLRSDHDINISGGKIDANVTNENYKHLGIFSGNNIYLGYSSSDDYIESTGYAYGGQGNGVYITANRKIRAGATVFDSGEIGYALTSDEIESLANHKLTPVTHTVTFSLTGDGPAVTSQTVAHGLPITVPTAENYKLVNWKKGEESYDVTTPVTADINLTAEWIQIGDLKVSNNVESDLAADDDVEFTFTVTLSDTSINGTYGDMTFTEGVATCKLKHVQDAKATGLPTSVTYTVTQTGVEGFDTDKTGDTGTITTTESTAAFTNTRQTGDLKVTNNVESDLAADANVEFTFKVELSDKTISNNYGDMIFENGEATVTLKGGEYAIAICLPTSVGYTITQAAQTGFELTDKTRDTGTISKEEMSTATFTNTRKTGDLTLTNNVVSDKVADADVDFTFRVELSDKTISKTYGNLEGTPIGMTFDEGVATVTLKGGKSAKATGLPTSVTYTVAQSEATGFVTGKTGDTGTISTTASIATFTNTRPTGDLTVSNTPYIDNDEEFEYTVTLSDNVFSKTYGGMTFTEGVATFSLKHGGPVTATGLPTGVTYTVTQTAKDGFATTKTGDTGTITTTPATAAFKNIKLTEASVSIDWKDGGNGSGRPQAGLTVNLLSKLKGSESAPLPVSGQQNKTLNAGNSWTVTIDELPKFNDAGEELEYSWSTITAPNGYLLTASNTSADGLYTFTKATTATLDVIWNDDNDRDKIRPTSLSATLIGYGGTIQQYEINADGGWTTTVNNLPMYDGEGALINYTWTVEAPQGYTLPEIPITTELTLRHTPETTSSTVIVNWNDDSNRDNIRPDNLTVTLWAKVGNNEAEALPQDQQPTISWTKGVDSWTASATGLKKYDNGTAINYKWTVKAMPEGYLQETPHPNGNDGINTTSLGLRHEISTTTATLQITWYDANNGDSRPSPVFAELYVGENIVGSVALNGNDWTATISDLPANANGVAIVYTWKLTVGSETELSQAGYSLINTNAATSPSGTVTTLIYRNAVAQPDFAFVESNVTATMGDEPFTKEPAGAQENPAITYSSSNEAVAEVDASTGEVTIKGSGVTTITATAAATNNYLPATAKYTLTVTGGSTVSIQLTETYGTFCWNEDLDFSQTTGLDAYIAAGYNASTGVLTMVKVTSVPAGTGLLLRGSKGHNYTATAQSSTWVYANLLTGTTAETSLYAGGKDFILGKKNSDIGFYPVSENGNIAAFKAYLHLESIPQLTNARGFVTLSFVDDATAVEAVRWKKETGSADAWYSLDGRKLQGKPTVKGMYIHNGRKEAVK